MIGMKIKKHGDMLLDKRIENINVEYVYVPLSNHQLNKNDEVKENELIGSNNNLNVYSSISGLVVDFTKKNTIRGLEDVVVIKKSNQQQIINQVKDNIDKKEFINLLKENSIIGLGGAGFPTYKKYDTNIIDTLVINAVECEPYAMSDYAIVMEYSKEIIETISKIMKINNIKKCYIGVKKNNFNVIKELKKYIKDNKIEISLVPALYPMGWERLLVKNTTNLTYDKLPIEKKIVVNNISTIYSIYEAFKGIPLTSRVITVTGNILNNPKNIKIKNGTLVKDILKEFNFSKNNYTIIAGGPMMGKEVDEDFVITGQVNSILIMEKEKNKSIACLRCGKCVNACPAKLDPVLIKDSNDNIDALKRLDPNRCIECGLCSYVCPSNIPVRDYVKKAKEKLRGE